MRECPAIIVALPREVKQLVQGWQRRELPGKIFVYTNESAVVACAGMGEARAALAVQAAMTVQAAAGRPVTALISAGLAGACDPALRVGNMVRAGVVIDSRTGEHFASSGFRQVLLTAPTIASIREKARLFASYSASAVDMEAAAVARIARGHELRFEAIKVISDEADFEIEGLSQFATEDGQFREAAFGAHAALRPRLWGRVSQLARNSSRALSALAVELDRTLKSYR